MFTPFKLERYFSKYEFTTQFLLSSSDCESMSIGGLLDLSPSASKDISNVWLGYTESTGNSGLRAVIAENYQSISPANILVHAGAQEAIYSFFQAIVEPGEHIVVLTPTYQSLYSIANDRGICVAEWKLIEGTQSWKVNIGELESLITPMTKAIVVNVPNNPTGFLFSQEEYSDIIEICKTQNIYLFVDEVYRGLEQSDAEQLPAICDLYERGISLGVLSKAYGLAGLRIGWVASKNDEIIERMAAFKDYLTICNSAPSEFLAKIALKNREKIIQRNRNLIENNLKIADSFFTRFSSIFKCERLI